MTTNVFSGAASAVSGRNITHKGKMNPVAVTVISVWIA
jgi:hypothetical protein